MEPLNMLVIADTHYIGTARHTCPRPQRKCMLALKFLEEVLLCVNKQEIDLLVILGDLVDNGNAEGAATDLIILVNLLGRANLPVIFVRGNHDVPKDIFFEITHDFGGVHRIKDYNIISFTDTFAGDESASRNWEQMEEYFMQINNSNSIIVLQHNPVYPPVERTYPFNIREAEKIARFYTEKGVLLSISGHAHWGIPLAQKDMVSYYTCAALCEEPYKFSKLTVSGRDFQISEFSIL